MSEKIVKRQGDPEKRIQSTKRFAQVGVYKQEYLLCQQNLEKLEDDLAFEKRKLAHVSSSLEEAQTKLSQAQEDIDCDPLPEGAQPKSRIQKRDLLQLVINYPFKINLHVAAIASVSA